MAAEISNAEILQFTNNVRLVLQQKKSKLRDYISVDSDCTGGGRRPDMLIGEAGIKERTTRYQSKTNQELTIEPRWVEPKDYDMERILEDKLDILRNGIQVNGQYTQAAVAAFNRKMDTIIFDAMFGSAKTGKNGTGTAKTFDASNMQVAAAGSGLTVDKLTDAMEILIAQEVDLDTEMPNLAITQKQWRDLRNDVQFTSGDFNIVKPLSQNNTVMVFTYNGFMMHVFADKRMNYVDGSDNRRCPFWVKSGVNLSIWDDMSMHLRQDFSLEGHPYEVYGMMNMGSTRLDEKKVGEILCDES